VVDIFLKGTTSLVEMRQTALLPGTLMDWVRSDEGLSEEEELATAVRVAVGTDALASTTDILPDPDSTDRKGWWGDLDAEEIWDGWAPIGCKCWLLMRVPIADANAAEGSTVMRAEEYVRAALRPFIVKRIASAIDVKAQRVGREEIDVWVTIYRGPLQAIQLRFAYLWNQVVAT
jgi:phage gp46-like protein